MNTITKKFYVQAEKYTWEDDFKVVVNSYQSESSENKVVIDIDETEIDFEVAEFTQEQFTSGHVEQLRKIKEQLKADTHMKLQCLDEQIESLLAIESK